MKKLRRESSSPKTCSVSSFDSYAQFSETSIEYSADDLSQLSDIVLLRILSFLPMKDAVQTGILSKRWEFLWTKVPNLDFHSPRIWAKDVKDFVNFVDGTIILYEGSKIQKFHICFNYTDWCASHVDKWIRFVIRKNVEELDLDFSGEQNIISLDGALYFVPQYLYTNPLLKKLRLSLCNIRPHVVISWRQLKNLSLAHVNLSDDLIKDMLSGSPLLEVLELNECRGLNYLDFTSTGLKKLMIHDYFDFENSEKVLKISAPNLQSLGVVLMNLWSLTDANLNFEVITHYGVESNLHEGHHNILKGFLEKLRYVEDLTIGSWCIQVLSIMELKIWPSLPSKCKCLMLDACLNKRELPGIARLLRSSPDMETLVVNKTSHRYIHFHSENNWKSQKPFSECKLHHLKIVKIFGFQTGNNVMEFIEFLLKNAIVLEKMFIYCQSITYLNWEITPNESLEFTRKLLSFPRASPQAVILFS